MDAVEQENPNPAMEQDTVECRICNEHFELEAIGRHIAAVHAMYTCHVCRVCEFRTSDSQEMMKHAIQTRHSMDVYQQVSDYFW